MFDNYSANVMVDGKPFNLGLWDTAGQEDYDRLRPLSYPQTDVALVAFSVTSPDSLANVSEKWVPELRHFIPNVPIVLVGCKSDLRNDRAAAARNVAHGQPMVTAEQAEAVVQRCSLQGYIETSALTQTNVSQCFAHAVRCALTGRKQQTKAKARFFSGWRTAKNGTKVFIDEASGMSRPMPVAPVMPETGKAPWVNPANASLSRDLGSLLHKSMAAHSLSTSSSASTAPQTSPSPSAPSGSASSATAPRYSYADAGAAAAAAAAAAAGHQPPQRLTQWFSDLELQLSTTETINAHKAVLAACSPTLERFVRAVDAGKDDTEKVPFALLPDVAGTATTITRTMMDVQQLQLLSADQPPAYVAAAPAAGGSVSSGAAAPAKVWPTLTPRAVRIVIEWLYTGEATRLPGANARQQQRRFVGTSDQEAWLDETVAAAAAFECEELQQCIANIRSGDGWLNPSFSTYLSDRTGNSAHALLCGRDWLSDVVIRWAATSTATRSKSAKFSSFGGGGAGGGASASAGAGSGSISDVAGSTRSIPGHASLLCARCPFLANQIAPGGEAALRFASEATVVDDRGRQVVTLPWTVDELPGAVLNAILEFIYRDHVEFGEIDANGNESGDFTALSLLPFAHKFQLARLASLCELRITKVIDAQVTESIRKSKCDVVGILNTAAASNATQLEAWCLFFVSSNRWSVAQMSSWKNMSVKHRQHVDSHQWPPPSYVKAAAKYEADLKKWKEDAAKLKKQQKQTKKRGGGGGCVSVGIGGGVGSNNVAGSAHSSGGGKVGCSIM